MKTKREDHDGAAASQGVLRAALDRSESGAPAAGKAVRDLFSTDEIFQRIVATADEEFERPARLLFLSGLAAGFSIGLSFVARAALTGATGGVDPTGLIGNLLYPLGFLLIVQGRYQLFTENTLTPVTLVLTRIASVPLLLRIWGIVLAANVLGAVGLAFVLSRTGVFDAEAAAAARSFGEHALSMPWGDLFWKGVFAGWIVASMVWLNHAARETTTRFLTVFVLMLLIPSADLFHCIIGACEVAYLAFQGLAGLGECAAFFTAVVLGNTAGGVLLVGLLNYAQTRDERFPDRDCGQLELTWREWLFGRYAGQPGAFRPGTPPWSQGSRDGATLTPPPAKERDHWRGPERAPVVLTQYGDYECPRSRQIHLAVQRLLGRRGEGEVAYVFRHLPLSRRHPHAERAAEAAEAAGAQGQFWPMHDHLFSHQDRLTDADLRRYAGGLGLDADQFADDLASHAHLGRVHEDRSAGVRSGVRRTSNLFVGGARYRGEFEPGAIGRAIDAALREERQAASAEE